MTQLYDDPWLYDLEHDDYRDDVTFYRRLAHDQDGPVLELGAGTGRLTVALAATGVDVVAVEPNAAMRARGEARAAAAAAEAQRRGARVGAVRFVDADARTLALGARFALVIAPFNTLMHLERVDEQDAALARVREHLDPSGAFACDVYAPRFGEPGVVRVDASWARSLGAGRDLFVWQHHDPVAQVVVSEHRLDALDPDGRVVRRAATLRQRYFHRFELERALRSAGFGDVRCYGGFERGPVLPTSEVWCFVARS